jgi:hypothetical protein
MERARSISTTINNEPIPERERERERERGSDLDARITTGKGILTL